MRKSRVKLNEVDFEILESISQDPIKLFDQFDALNIKLPSWSNFVLLGLDIDRAVLDVMFFEEVQDFFIRYAKILIRRQDSSEVFSYHKKEIWKFFEPPTLIGVDLTTSLRPVRNGD